MPVTSLGPPGLLSLCTSVAPTLPIPASACSTGALPCEPFPPHLRAVWTDPESGPLCLRPGFLGPFLRRPCEAAFARVHVGGRTPSLRCLSSLSLALAGQRCPGAFAALWPLAWTLRGLCIGKPVKGPVRQPAFCWTRSFVAREAPLCTVSPRAWEVLEESQPKSVHSVSNSIMLVVTIFAITVTMVTAMTVLTTTTIFTTLGIFCSLTLC